MSDTSTRDRYPAGRYPSRSALSRGKRWALAALSVAIGLLVAFVLYQQLGSSEIESEVVAFDIVDDQTIDIQLKVTRQDPSREAVCIVRARSRDGSETGRREVLVPPSETSTVVLTSTVKTSQRPGMGDDYGCSFNVPDYLRAP